jgi:pentatricopeptide repeat protein
MYTLTTSIVGCLNGNDYAGAMLLYNKIFELELEPVIQIYTALIEYCITKGDPTKVKEFLKSMQVIIVF